MTFQTTCIHNIIKIIVKTVVVFVAYICHGPYHNEQNVPCLSPTHNYIVSLDFLLREGRTLGIVDWCSLYGKNVSIETFGDIWRHSETFGDIRRHSET